MSDYNISLKTYTKAQENFKNELIKKMTSFHKMNTNKKQKNTHQTILSTDKIYNFFNKHFYLKVYHLLNFSSL